MKQALYHHRRGIKAVQLRQFAPEEDGAVIGHRNCGRTVFERPLTRIGLKVPSEVSFRLPAA